MVKRRLRIAGSLTAAALVLAAVLLLVTGTGVADSAEPASEVSNEVGASEGTLDDEMPRMSLPPGEEETGEGCPCLVAQKCPSAAEATTSVSITENGFDPEVVTVTVGSSVVWKNYLSEPVHLVLVYRIFLPLVMRSESGGAASGGGSDSSVEPVGLQQLTESGVRIDPGGSTSHTFTHVGTFRYTLREHREWSNEVQVQRLPSDESVVMWATGDQGVLLRWRWPHTDPETGQPAEQPTGYNVYRDGVLLNTEPITRVTDPRAAEHNLGSHWAWIQATYTDVTTIAELHAFLDGNPLAEHWLADQRYPVALIRGLGYLDGDVLPADPDTHSYRVEALLASGPQEVGTVSIRNDGATPLAPPAPVTLTTTVSDTLLGSPDWVVAQENRKAHGNLFLKWALPEESEAEASPDAWVTSYEVYRAGPLGRGDDPATADYARITETPVVPMEDHDPTLPESLADTDVYTVPHARHDFFFADTDLQPCGEYAYRVGPRDLLGQAVQQSTYVMGSAPDTMPPAAPVVLTPTVDHVDGDVTITWRRVTDAERYFVYRSEVMTAAWPGLADCAATPCWTKMATRTTALREMSWVDTGADYEQRYWYVVRAEDQPCGADNPPNLSAPSNAVTAILHDREPPNNPTVHLEGTTIEIHPDLDDATHSLLYATFDDDPWDGKTPDKKLLVAEIPTTTTTIDLQSYYTPAVPVSYSVWVQSVDAHGNRSALTPPEGGGPTQPLCPSDPLTLTRPAIGGITTEDGGTHGYTAVITWSAQTDLPQLQGYRVYRRVGQGVREEITPDMLDRDQTAFRDTTVEPGILYYYLVGAVRTNVCKEFIGEDAITSQPRLYKISPSLGTCQELAFGLFWDSVSFSAEQGTLLHWYHPYEDEYPMRAVVYRSLSENGNYVAITPPFDSLAGQYLDAEAAHDGYWYVVTMLDWATGEILYTTSPTTPQTTTAGSGVGDHLASSLDELSLSSGMPASPEGGGSSFVQRELSDARLAQAVVPSSDGARLQEIDIPAYMDTYVAKEDPGENFGDEEVLGVWHSSEAGVEAHALVQFDQSELPADAVIDGAAFHAYNLGELAQGDGPIQLHRITEAWEEMETVWSDRPLLADALVTATVGTSSGWVGWEVTPLVEAWQDGTHANHGIAMVPAGESPVVQRGFASREEGHAPYLHIEYTPLPQTLLFGSGDGNLFEVTGVTYAPGSTPDCLTGSGSVSLGGAGLPTYDRAVSFSCIQADIESGVVSSGVATATLPSAIAVAYPDGLSYDVASLYMDETTAWGQVNLTLPDGIVFHYAGTRYDPLPLTDAILHQDLSFDAHRAWSASCHDHPPTYAFQTDPLPLRLVPLGPVTFTHETVNLGQTCTQYVDRYTEPAAPPPEVGPTPVANHGYLSATYTSTQPIYLYPNGLSGTFSTDEMFSYTTLSPYGFQITARGATFGVSQGRIGSGMLFETSLELDYYDVPADRTPHGGSIMVDTPDRTFRGSANHLAIGPGGALSGQIWAGDNPPSPVIWMGGGFILQEEYYQLYIPPAETAATRTPWQEVVASWANDPTVEAGLNLVKDQVDFTWEHCAGECASPTVITFPEGVGADLYLRRGGVTDLLEATISPDSGVTADIYGYEHMFRAFRFAFCENLIYDSEVEADVYLPWPADVTVPLIDMRIDEHNACVNGGTVRGDADPLTPAYWDVDLHPRGVEYRPLDACERHMWIGGTMDVPHLAPPGDWGAAPIPLEISFEPDGAFHDVNPVHNQATYLLDGFDFLLSDLSLSRVGDDPDCVTEATLAQPPDNDWNQRGFVALEGSTFAPVFGTLKAKGSLVDRPRVIVLGWDDYMGFSAQPRALRIWTAAPGVTWDFDLVYAQHHNTAEQRGTFAGFRGKRDLEVVDLDQALVLNSWSADARGADLLLGLSSGAGVLRALAETTVSLPPELSGPLVTTMTTWADKFGMDVAYIDVLTATWSQFGNRGYTQTTEMIDAWADTHGDDEIPDVPTSGATKGDLRDWGLQLDRMRGKVGWTQDEASEDWHFEELRASLWLDVKRPGDDGTLLHADRMTLYVTRDGDYVLEAKGIACDVYVYAVKNVDAILAINPNEPTFEAGLTLHDFRVEGVIAERAAAVLGLGRDLFYVGVLVDDAHPEYAIAGKWRMGGAFLFGSIDPGSHVLRNTGFKSVLEDIGATGASQGNGLDDQGRLVGAYIRVYGEVPIYDYGCMFRVTAGGEIAAWYFAEVEGANAGCSRYGGRLRGYIHGKLLCVVSARGDLTLEIYRVPPAHGGGCGEASMRGQFWAAGGLGFCEPETWTSWESKWWGDGWCWTAGAMVEAEYDGNTGDWDWDYQAAYE